MTQFFISLLTFLEVASALLLIIVILMQRSRSGGGLGAIGGGATEEVFGSAAGNVLTKTTIILSLFFFINTLGLAVLQGNALRDRNVSIVEQSDTVGDDLPGDGLTKDAPRLTGTNEVETPATDGSK